MKKFISFVLLFLWLVLCSANLAYAIDYQDISITERCGSGVTTVNKQICAMILLHEKAILQQDIKIGSCWSKYYITWPSSNDSEKMIELQLWFLSNKATICKPIYDKQDEMIKYISYMLDKIKKQQKFQHDMYTSLKQVCFHINFEEMWIMNYKKW